MINLVVLTVMLAGVILGLSVLVYLFVKSNTDNGSTDFS